MPLSHFSSLPDKEIHSKTLEHMIIGFAFAMSVGILVFLIIVITDHYGEKLDLGRQITKNLAKILDEHTDRSVNTVDIILRDLTRLINLKLSSQVMSDTDLLRAMNKESSLSPLIRALFFVGPDGFIRQSTGNPPNGPPPAINLADREYFKGHLRGPDVGLHISAPVLSKTTRDYFIPFSRAVRSRTGKLLGVIVAAVSPEYFRDIYHEIDIGEGGTLVVALTTGDLLARVPYTETENRPLSAEEVSFRTRLSTSPNGTYIAAGIEDGIERIVSYRTLVGYPIVVAVGLSVKDLLWPVHIEVIHETLLTTLFILSICVLSYALIRQLRRRDQLSTTVISGESRFRALFASNPIPMWVYCSRSLRFLEVNAAAIETYGYSRDQFLQMTVSDIRPSEDIPRFLEHLANRQPSGMKLGEWRHRLRNGKVIDVEIAGHPITFGDKQAVLVATIDISARKAAEALLRQSQKMEAIGQLTGGIAHDFNNRLAAILGNLELLADKLREDPQKLQLVSSALRSTLRGAELTHRLLAFSRMQSLQPELVDINELITQTADLLRRTLVESIQIEILLTDRLWMTLIDPAQLEDAVLNLALNSRDAMPLGGRLTIKTANVTLWHEQTEANEDVAPGCYVMIAVTDTGHGIAKENIDKIFEPFFTTKDRGKGTGLGMSMVYGFVKQSGGHVDVYSEVGHGATVRMYFPKASDDDTRTRASEDVRKIGNSLPSDAAVGGEEILVVEDDPEVRQAVGKILEDLGYIVHLAEDGRSGLTLLDQHPDIRLMITDVELPGGMRGPEVVQRARQVRHNLKFLYMSGYAKKPAVSDKQIDDGVALINKPFQKTTFTKLVRATLK